MMSEISTPKKGQHTSQTQSITQRFILLLPYMMSSFQTTCIKPKFILMTKTITSDFQLPSKNTIYFSTSPRKITYRLISTPKVDTNILVQVPTSTPLRSREQYHSPLQFQAVSAVAMNKLIFPKSSCISHLAYNWL